MALVGSKDLAKELAHLAAVGAGKGLWDSKDMEMIFNGIARACKRPIDKQMYFAKCLAHGLSPVRNELFAIERKGKTRDGKTFSTVTYVTSYYVFVSRARQAGYLIQPAVVAKNDEFRWDGVRRQPKVHEYDPSDLDRSLRQNIVGAYATVIHAKTNEVAIGNFWPAAELLMEGANPLRERIPGHFCWKTAACRMARMVAPDVNSLYGVEEFGYTLDGPVDTGKPVDLSDRPPHELVKELEAQGAVTEIKTDDGIEDAEFREAPKKATPPADGEATADFSTRSTIQRRLAKERNLTAPADVLEFIARVSGSDLISLKEITQSQASAVLAELGEEAK